MLKVLERFLVFGYKMRIFDGCLGFEHFARNKEKIVSIMGTQVACAQTSPLPQKKSGEETSVSRRR